MAERTDMRTASQRGTARPEVLISTGLVCAFFLTMGIAFLSFRHSHDSAHARADLRRLLPAADDYFAYHGTYRGMTLAALRSNYDAELPTARYKLRAAAAGDYCVETTVGGTTWHLSGRAGDPARGACYQA
jgi:hypothetical protein